VGLASGRVHCAPHGLWFILGWVNRGKLSFYFDPQDYPFYEAGRIGDTKLPIASAKGSYDTNHDTTGSKSRDERTQLLENMVELVGIEPTTSSLRTMRSPS
jgi:hypothetical protein